MAGVMNSIRERAGGVLVGVLVVAFGGLWALQDSGAFDNVGMGRDGRVIGEVNGDPIEGELYQNAITQQTNAFQAQGNDLNGAMRRQLEDQTFNGLVDATLVEQEMERLGVEVTDDEVFDLITGPNPDPLIRQVFGDGQGNVDRAALQQVIDATDANPELLTQLQAIEEQVRRNRRQAKLSALIAASARVSPSEVREAFVRQNRRASAQLVALRYADVPDDEVAVTDDELQDYYRANRDDYDRPATYSVEYIAFDKTPTAADSARALDELRTYTDGLRQADQPLAFAQRNSYNAVQDTSYVGAGALPAELATAIFSNPTVGRVIGPIVAGDQAYVTRITGVQDGGEEAVRARHILLPVGSEAQATALRERIASGEISFADAARQNSVDESNKMRGGELGWFSRGRMVAAFEDAVFSAPQGQVVGPVETPFGQHLILVEGRTTQQVQLAQISRPVEADFQRVQEQAQDFVVFLEEEGDDFAEAAQAQGIAPTEVQVTEEQSQLPGLDLGRDFFRFVRRAGDGDVSDPFDAGESFVVARVTGSTEAGPAPFEEVASQVETAVLLEKKTAVQRARLEGALGRGSLASIAQAAGTDVDEVSDLSMVAGTIPGYGVEPRAVGAAFGLEPGQRSGIIEGDQAVFVVRTTSLTGATDAELTDEVREQLAAQILQQKRQRVLQSWLQGLRDEADIEDYRNDLLG